jgi:hypothetical protein
MTKPLLSLRFSDHARDQLSTLDEVDRRRVNALCNDLRNWDNDEFIHKLARPVPSMEGAYLLRTGSDWVIGFRLSATEVTILSIFHEDTVRTFEAAAQVGA